MAAGATHYDVLNASPSSTLEQIRACYRAALLSVHPDKVALQAVLRNSDCGPSVESVRDASQYLRVQEAWNVLKDADSRAAYDSLVQTGGNVVNRRGELNIVVGEEIALEEMEESVSETGNVEYWHPCRCSDFFLVGGRELQETGLGFVDKNSGKLTVDGEFRAFPRQSGELSDAGGKDGIDWARQRQSIVLPCGSCSLHLRVHYWVPCP